MAEPHHHAVLLVAIAFAATCAAYDWRRGEIPNALTFTALIMAPLIHVGRFVAVHAPMETALYEGAYAVGGAVICSLVPLILYRQNAIGGGDVKLFAALGALLQTMLGVEAQMYAFFAAALLAPAHLAYQGKLLSTIKNAGVIFVNIFLPKDRRRSVDAAALSWFRLGPAVFLGVFLTSYLHW